MSKWLKKRQILEVFDRFPNECDSTIAQEMGITVRQVRYVAIKYNLHKSRHHIKDVHRPQAIKTNQIRWNR